MFLPYGKDELPVRGVFALIFDFFQKSSKTPFALDHLRIVPEDELAEARIKDFGQGESTAKAVGHREVHPGFAWPGPVGLISPVTASPVVEVYGDFVLAQITLERMR